MQQKTFVLIAFCILLAVFFVFLFDNIKENFFYQRNFSENSSRLEGIPDLLEPEREILSDGDLLEATDEFSYVVAKVEYPFGERFANLYYEGNNQEMRGEKDEIGFYFSDGEKVAMRWVEFAQGTKGVFLLRDSLWNQQDHAVRQKDPKALILPPSWIVALAVEMSEGNLIIPAVLPLVEEDSSWLSLASVLEIISIDGSKTLNSLPIDEALFELATQSTKNQDEGAKRLIKRARLTLRQLNSYLEELSLVEPQMPQAIAERGAEIISRGDKEYFGSDVRHDYIIPLFVENPSLKEIEEGKGFVLGDSQPPNYILNMVRTIILRKRLEDGDIAIERYDLSHKQTRDHLIKILEAVVPKAEMSSNNHTLWVWVVEPADQEDDWRGSGVINGAGLLRQELEKSDVDSSRVRIITTIASFSKPGPKQVHEFQTVVKNFTVAQIWLRFNLITRQLRRLIEQ